MSSPFFPTSRRASFLRRAASVVAVYLHAGLVVLLKVTWWLICLAGFVCLLIGTVAASAEGNFAIALVFGVAALLCLGLVWGD